MSISPRSRPPGLLSSRNQSPRSERSDGSGLRNPARGASDTPASAAARNKALQEDVGRNQARVMAGVATPTPAALPAAPGQGRAAQMGGDAVQGRSGVMRMPAPPLSTATQRMQSSRKVNVPLASGGRAARRADLEVDSV